MILSVFIHPENMVALNALQKSPVQPIVIKTFMEFDKYNNIYKQHVTYSV